MPMKSYETFALWAADQSAKHRGFIKTLKTIVAKAAPHLEEGVKWGNGVFIGQNPVVYFYAGYDDHLQLGFFAGSKLSDDEERLEGKGQHVRHVKIRKNADIDAGYFTKLIKEAAALEGKARPSKKGSQENPSPFATLSAPAQRALASAKIKGAKELAKFTEKEILDLHGMGPASLPKLRAALKKAGLSFRKETTSSGRRRQSKAE